MRSNASMRRVFASNCRAARANEMPRITRATMPAAATTMPEITALAARHISCSFSLFSFALNIGMNAADKAPSPSRRRNRLGI